MGVTRDPRDIFYYDNAADDLETLEEDINQEKSEVKKYPKRRNFRHNNSLYGMTGHVDNLTSGSRKQKQGVRRARRGDNLRYLMSLLEKDDDCQTETDSFEPTMSAFAELFMEHEKMKVWNDFINSSEDEQNIVLQKVRQDKQNGNEKEVEKSPETLLDDTWEEIQDNRTVHPAFSAEESFKHIDKKIKSVLKRRQFPMGMLSTFEGDIISFFKEWPNSVYISKLTSSYERMMLHALCQYLGLVSHSYESGGCRQTQVENKHPSFHVPSMLLTTYLQKATLS